MGHSEPNKDNDARGRLMEAARALVLRGDGDFSISSLCREAGVDRLQFRNHFGGRTELIAAVMKAQSATAPISQIPAAPQTVQAVAPAVHESASEQTPKAEQTSEPAVSTPDAWLERRLRVFERALNALEVKAEASAREQARTLAQLQERLNGLPAAPSGSEPAPAAISAPVPVPAPVLAPVPEPEKPKAEAAPSPAKPQTPRVELAGVMQAEVPPAEEMLAAPRPAMIAPDPIAAAAKEEMAGMLQSAREKARAAAETLPEAPPPGNAARTRWLVIGALSLVALLAFIGFSLGRNAFGGSATAREGDGISHRHAASNVLAKTTALADAGDARAQARLALAYLRGQGSAGDANAALLWSLSAARSGNAVAQYLVGALYQQGDHVKADPAIAFAWFSRAAEKGNLKAMHNLAIAYAQGLGTTKDEAKAAAWFTRAAERGYVDSAFDLAVLYERGTGVTQDLRQALKWYGIAAIAGDAPSKGRADFLRGQMKAADIKLADTAAMAFAPLPALAEANSL